jgi:hypothetical protein
MERSGLSRWLAAAWTTVALVALLARAIIPAGFMPALDARTGAIEFTICSANPAHSFASIDLGTVQNTEPDQPSPAPPDCPFALSVAVVLPHADPSLAIPIAFAAIETSDLQPIDVAYRAASWGRHAPPTGPPVLI